MNNVFIQLYKQIYDNTKDTLPEFTTIEHSQYNRYIYNITDPIVETFIFAKDKKIAIDMLGKDIEDSIDMLGKDREDSIIIIARCSQRQLIFYKTINLKNYDLEYYYSQCFECVIPFNWKTRNLVLEHSLNNIRNIIKEEYLKNNIL